MKTFRVFLFVLMFQPLVAYPQNRKYDKDSIAISSISSDFFRWYISTAKDKMKGECNPVFIQDKNGMTTLDYSKYMENLTRLSFSDSLIAKEKLSYQVCIDKLATVKYPDFVKFDGLDDFENIHCDFTNYYRWTGGQEMFDKYSVIRVKIDKKRAVVMGFLFNDDNESKGYKREISMTFIKQDNKWSIFNIEY